MALGVAQRLGEEDEHCVPDGSGLPEVVQGRPGTELGALCSLSPKTGAGQSPLLVPFTGLARCCKPCGLAPSWEQNCWSERCLCCVFVVEYSSWPPVGTESVVLSLCKQ